VPYLQLDLPGHYPAPTKRALAARLGALYAQLMQTSPRRVNVGFRELGADSLYRCGDGEPEPAAVVMCDVRRGRLAEQRLALAEAIVAACVELLNLRPDRIVVEFTQHAGDEMYRDGAWGADWDPREAHG
jgi:phenylpyruvate tautomerase PptA (4-oxalocrotonate tautomerase family)